MAKIGKNQKWTVNPANRTKIRDMFTSAFEAKYVEKPGIDIFDLGDVGTIGVAYEDDALDEARARKGAWVEFLVSDVPATTRALGAKGLTPLEYADKANTYFQAPGGPVFRIAKA